MASGRIFRVHLNFLLTLLATQATSPCVAESKAVASLKMVMQGLQTLPFCWTVLTGQINVCAAKNDHTFLAQSLKMLLDMACQLVYSRFHSSKTDDIMELLLLQILQHRRKKLLPYHVIYTCNTNLIYREGSGILKSYKLITHKQEVQYRILVGIVAR